ncbi:thioredoxin [Blochmannia endosymbiont of Camponotus (Colobopsis) obliquus]|uniref:thioredoxin n=1 Tax=Blochmannia endosymbiont of Camponotus (Colobopsis) obliquus TaxID=1505597 RepID=UPI00061A56C8|nr:thioredoxin [Blochmannia endosymbiont of Camponotus (Colobopsis) obliquus]AKC60728.1 Thioredoxin-1 [Blochmannia endosymbiont of Camponotus (Colobopsis) obliquus]
MNSKIINLNDDMFEDKIIELTSNGLLLVDFWAEWCNPCKVLSLVLDEMLSENNCNVIVAKLNIDENPIVTKKYEIRSIPTLLLFKGSKVLATKVGVLSKKQLKEFLSSYL